MRKFRWLVLLALCLALAVAVGVAQAQSLPPEDGNEISSVDVAGNLPWQYGVLDSATGEYTGRYVSMAISPHNGVVYVSYYDATDGNLRMAHSVDIGTGNCGPSNAWKCETIDSGGTWIISDDVGQYSSIDVVWIARTFPSRSYNKVGISYYNATDHTLKYAEYYCPSSMVVACYWTTMTVDSSGDSGDRVGESSSVKLNANGVAQIAYHYYDDADGIYDFPIHAVYYAYDKSDGTGNCGDDNDWACDSIDWSISTTGTHISLDLTYEGIPYIAFYQVGDLYYAWYQGFGGACGDTAWHCVLIDDGDGSDVGRYVSLHAPDSSTDKFRFAYYDYTNGTIRYAVAVGSGGNCTSTAYTCYYVDTVGAEFALLGLSLSVDSEGAPIIAYQHDNQEQYSVVSLKVARPASRMGQSFGIGNCGEVPPGYLFMYWWCETVDDGYQDIVWDADFAAVAVNPDGLAYVAYYESDSYNMEGRLKIAWQSFHMLYLPYMNKMP